jgi:guanine deaminase
MHLDKNVSTYNSDYYLKIFNEANLTPAILIDYTITLATINVGQRPNNTIEGGPFGAIIYDPALNQIVGLGTNHVVPNSDPSAHAEVTAIRDAIAHLKHNDMSRLHLYTSCECCPMCLAFAISHGIKRIYFAATRHDAADAFFSDEEQYRLIKLPITAHASFASTQDKELLGNFEAAIIDENNNIISTATTEYTETPIVDALKKACSKLKTFHLPENYKLISKHKPHPYSLIALDWARIGRVRDVNNPEDPSKDKFEKDTSKITYILNTTEPLGNTFADDSVWQNLLNPSASDIAIEHIECSEAKAPFNAWLKALYNLNNAVKY